MDDMEECPLRIWDETLVAGPIKMIREAEPALRLGSGDGSATRGTLLLCRSRSVWIRFQRFPSPLSYSPRSTTPRKLVVGNVCRLTEWSQFFKVRLSPVDRVVWQHLPSFLYLNLSHKLRISAGRRFADSVFRPPIRSMCLDATGWSLT